MCPDKRRRAPLPPSTVPFLDKLRHRAEQVRLWSMVLQMLDRLAYQHRALTPGTVLTEQRNEGCLARPFVLAQPFARCGLIAGMIKQIVGDLESEADVAGIAAVRGS